MVPLITIANDDAPVDTANTALPTGTEKVEMVHAMFDRIAGRYDLMNRMISLGLDIRWRQRAIAVLGLAPGGVIADVGAGTADLARSLRAAKYKTIAIDLSFEMLAASRGDHGPLLQADAVQIPFGDASCDGVISGFALRNFSDVQAIFDELARITRPGGRLCILEVDRPKSIILRAGHHLWFTWVVPRLGALLSDSAAYRYLPRSVAYLPTFAALQELLTRAGYGNIHRTPLNGGIAQLLTATRNGNYGIRNDHATATSSADA